MTLTSKPKTEPGLRSTLAEALEKSGAVLKRLFGKVRIRYKGHADIVTRADLESQDAALGVIRRRYPGHGFLAEETPAMLRGAPHSQASPPKTPAMLRGAPHSQASPPKTPAMLRGSPYLWVIDPLDGTTNYAHGYPAACVSIGLLHRGEPLLAGVYDPFRDECFTAEAGRGARMNGTPLRVSRTPRLKDSLLITGFAYDRAARSHFYVEFYRSFMVSCHDVRRSGSAALDLAWIAAGRADGFWEFGLSPWDVAAGLLLVREAGGKVTDFSDRPWTEPAAFGRQTLATNGRIHEEMLRVLEGHG